MSELINENKIEIFIERVEQKDDQCRICGWCAAPMAFTVQAFDTEGTPLEIITERSFRPDVKAAFPDRRIDPYAGFVLTIPSFSEKVVRLCFLCAKGSTEKTICLDESVKQASALRKTMDYAKDNGISGLSRKLFRKLRKGSDQPNEGPGHESGKEAYEPEISVFLPAYHTNPILKKWIGTPESASKKCEINWIRESNGHAVEAAVSKIVIVAKNDDEKTQDTLREWVKVLEDDPSEEQKKEHLLRLVRQEDNEQILLAFDHNIGGGASSYLRNQFEEKEKKDFKCFAIRYDGNREVYRLLMHRENLIAEVRDPSLENLLLLLKETDEIWINELVTYPDLEATLHAILKFRAGIDAKLCFKLHDFFCICPAVTLVDENFTYCDIAEPKRCNECIKTNENALPGGFTDIAAFRSEWGRFLGECDEITAFSDSSAEILKRAYPSLENIEIIPHKTTPLPKPEMGEKKTETFNIGILGAINENKGRIIIDECVEEIEQTGRKDHICLIGYANKEYDSPAITVTGAYKRDQVAKLVEENDIDVFIIPSIWPETFSYTSSEIMSMDIPLAVFNIGAPPERVKDYEKGLILERYEGAGKLLDSLEEFGKKFSR